MNVVIVDLETFWSSTHSLTKMNPIVYAMHPETEIQSISVRKLNGRSFVLFGEDSIRKWVATVDWSKSMLIGHNMSGFDAMLFAWRFGVNPKMWGCTLAMARLFYAKVCRLSLKELAKELKLGFEKGSLDEVGTKGKKLKDFTADELRAMKVYNKVDTDLCAGLFIKLVKRVGQRELKLIDMTIRMLTEPAFEVDQLLLEQTLQAVRDEKEDMLLEIVKLLAPQDMLNMSETDQLEFARKELASAAKFGKFLELRGVPIPLKPSPSNSAKLIPALAKSDKAFTDMLDHADPQIRLAVEARLGVKSTLLETRMESLLVIARAMGGKMPIPLNYAGADTTRRWSGSMKINMQNLPRVNSKEHKHSDALRKCLRAPAGHKVVVADLSGIELRVNHFLWQVPSSMKLFELDPDDADLYKAFASESLYHVPEDEVTKEQRQLGKVCLAEGTMVLTDKGEVPIEQVTTRHRVWDGVEWVPHDGPIYNGEREVIYYDGIEATPDHEVWVESGEKVKLQEAADQGRKLQRTGAGGNPVGLSRSGTPAVHPEGEPPLRGDSVHAMWDDQANKLRQLEVREVQRVPVLQSEMWGTSMALAATGVGQTAMHQPERPRIHPLRGSRHLFYVSVSESCGGLGNGEFGATARIGTGPQKQRRALRAGELEVGFAENKHGQPATVSLVAVPSVQAELPRRSVRRQHIEEDVKCGVKPSTDSAAMAPPIGKAKRRVWDLLNCGPRHRFTANGRLVSNCQLGLGFGSGAQTFVSVARSMGGITLTLPESVNVVQTWRAAYPEIVAGWRTCQQALVHIFNGDEGIQIDPWGLCHTMKGGIKTPQGQILYPGLRREKDDNDRWQFVYGYGAKKARIYGPKVVENCIAENTEVLTDRGWVPIQSVTTADLVHDGEKFVIHGGKVFKSVQECVTVDGVYMTPDHEVLTDEGWQAASQSPRPFRPNLWGAEGFEFGGHRQSPSQMESGLQMRDTESDEGCGHYARSKTGWNPKLWVPNETTYISSQPDPRAIPSPSLCSVAKYESSVLSAYPQSVEKLWRTGHQRLQPVVRIISKLLGRYGPFLPARAGLRPQRQRRALYPRELSVGNTQGKRTKPAKVTARRGHSEAGAGNGHSAVDIVLQSETGAALNSSGRQTKKHKVYDIINAGPLQRFVVRGDNGPFIVHNCVQHLARECMADMMLEIQRYYPIKHTVHDEIILIVPEKEAQAALDYMLDTMKAGVDWWPELITSAEGDYADCYGDSK